MQRYLKKKKVSFNNTGFIGVREKILDFPALDSGKPKSQVIDELMVYIRPFVVQSEQADGSITLDLCELPKLFHLKINEYCRLRSLSVPGFLRTLKNNSLTQAYTDAVFVNIKGVLDKLDTFEVGEFLSFLRVEENDSCAKAVVALTLGRANFLKSKAPSTKDLNDERCLMYLRATASKFEDLVVDQVNATAFLSSPSPRIFRPIQFLLGTVPAMTIRKRNEWMEKLRKTAIERATVWCKLHNSKLDPMLFVEAQLTDIAQRRCPGVTSQRLAYLGLTQDPKNLTTTENDLDRQTGIKQMQSASLLQLITMLPKEAVFSAQTHPDSSKSLATTHSNELNNVEPWGQRLFRFVSSPAMPAFMVGFTTGQIPLSIATYIALSAQPVASSSLKLPKQVTAFPIGKQKLVVGKPYKWAVLFKNAKGLTKLEKKVKDLWRELSLKRRELGLPSITVTVLSAEDQKRKGAGEFFGRTEGGSVSLSESNIRGKNDFLNTLFHELNIHVQFGLHYGAETMSFDFDSKFAQMDIKIAAVDVIKSINQELQHGLIGLSDTDVKLYKEFLKERHGVRIRHPIEGMVNVFQTLIQIKGDMEAFGNYDRAMSRLPKNSFWLHAKQLGMVMYNDFMSRTKGITNRPVSERVSAFNSIFLALTNNVLLNQPFLMRVEYIEKGKFRVVPLGHREL